MLYQERGTATPLTKEQFALQMGYALTLMEQAKQDLLIVYKCMLEPTEEKGAL